MSLEDFRALLFILLLTTLAYGVVVLMLRIAFSKKDEGVFIGFRVLLVILSIILMPFIALQAHHEWVVYKYWKAEGERVEKRLSKSFETFFKSMEVNQENEDDH